MKTTNHVIGISSLVYRWLLHVYPQTFRQRFEGEMRQMFRDQCRSMVKSRGTLGLLAVWWSTLIDLAKTAPVEQFIAMDRWALVFLTLGIGDGLFAAYVDFHNNEVQPAVLVILVCSFLFGIIRPKGAWRWALAVGIGVPFCHICGKWVGITGGYPAQPSEYGSLVALIPAFVGSYFGALMRISVSYSHR